MTPTKMPMIALRTFDNDIACDYIPILWPNIGTSSRTTMSGYRYVMMRFCFNRECFKGPAESLANVPQGPEGRGASSRCRPLHAVSGKNRHWRSKDRMHCTSSSDVSGRNPIVSYNGYTTVERGPCKRPPTLLRPFPLLLL
eukprot:2747043-Amphidinium_carterae.1